MPMQVLKYKHKLGPHVKDPKFIGTIDSWEIYECNYDNRIISLGAVNDVFGYECWDLRRISLNYVHWMGMSNIILQLSIVLCAYKKYYLDKNKCPCKC